MNFKILRFFIYFIFLSNALKSQGLHAHYRIYDVQKGSFSSFQEIAQAMNNYDVVLFGEEHNDSVTHFAQFSLLQALHSAYPGKVVLSMEMFDRDVQPVIDEYLGDFIKERHFKKDARVWSNYGDYRPMVEFAKAQKIAVIAANAAGRYSNLAGREGNAGLKKLPKSSHMHFAPLPYDSASGKYYNKLLEIMGGGHSASSDTSQKVPPAMAMGGFNMMMAQSLWDATMAFSISEGLKKKKGAKIIHLNGRFHSDEKLGVYTHLKKYAPRSRILVISSLSDERFLNLPLSEISHLGDYVLVSDPAIPRTYE